MSNAETSLTLDIQGPYEPALSWINPDSKRGDKFAAVRVAGDERVSAEVFVTTRAEAEQFIAVFTEARDGLPEEPSESA